MSNVKTKLIVYFMTLITLILVLFSVASLNVLKAGVIREVESQLISNAKNAQKIILSRTAIKYTYLEGLAQRKEIFNKDSTLDEKVYFLKNQNNNQSHFNTIGFADTNGNLYLSGLKESIDISERQYYIDSLDGNHGVMTPTPSINPMDNGDLIMVYSVPVFEDGEIIGVIVATAKPWILSELIDDIKFGESGYAYIIDQYGTTISHPNYDYVIEQFNVIEESHVQYDFLSVGLALEEALIKKTGASSYTFNGNSLYMGYSKIEDLNWLVVVTANQKEVLNGLSKAQRHFLSISAGILCISLLSSFLIGQSVLNKEKYVTEKFNKVFYTNPALMAIQTFPELALTECNQIFLNKLGYSKDELKENITSLLKPVLSESTLALLKNNARIDSIALILYTKTGQPIDCFYSCEIITHGNTKYLLSVIVDITEIKHYEKALITAKEKAESANLLKSQFLANMSHEIRTPINGIMGYLKLMEYTPLNPEQQVYIQGAEASSEALTLLIEDILDLSKIEAGKIRFETIPFSAIELVETSVKMIYPKIHEKNLELHWSTPDTCHEWFYGDPHRLSQVLNNLLSNAIKFTEKGQIEINVSCEASNKEVEVLKFSVSDSGIGISPEAINIIFDNFVQADLSTKRQYGGTGLGLSISKQIVETLGGTFEVSSEIGKGSTFTFSLPLKRCFEYVDSDTSFSDKKTTSEETLKNLSQLKLLLVEDHTVNQLIFEAILKKQNLTTDIVRNGKEAIEAVEKKQYDVIFMDCNMPIMDGYEATTLIRQMPLPKQPYIIAMTANAMEGDKDKCFEVGMNDYMSKPIDFDNVISHLLKSNPNS